MSGADVILLSRITMYGLGEFPIGTG